MTPGGRILVAGVASGFSGYIAVPVGKLVLGRFFAADHFSALIVFVVTFAAIGQMTLAPLIQKLALRFAKKSGGLGPPLNATFLLYLFYDAQNCDALVGDLEERHKLIRKKFGARRANFWYWVQVITSVGPMVWAWTKKLLKAISGVAALVEVWRRIRS